LTAVFSFAFKNWIVSREMPDMMLQIGMIENKYTPYCPCLKEKAYVKMEGGI
jgi:hypothetical protein